MGTCASVLAPLWESRWWGHLRACARARDESCGSQSGRRLWVDSFPSGLWMRLMVHIERWVAGRGSENQLPHRSRDQEWVKHQPKEKRTQKKAQDFICKAQRSIFLLSFRYPGSCMCRSVALPRRHLIVNRIVYSLAQIIRLEYTCINTSSSGGETLAPFAFNNWNKQSYEDAFQCVMYKWKRLRKGWYFVIHIVMWWMGDTFSTAI